jgi:hypothetical protein
MQLRFDALGGYVKAVVNEESERGLLEEQRAELSNDQIAFIQLMVFVYSLGSFLRDGSRAAQGAADVFGTLGAEGFAVGKTLFTKGNENTTRGNRLADELHKAIAGTHYADILRDARSMRELVKSLIREVKRGHQGLD